MCTFWLPKRYIYCMFSSSKRFTYVPFLKSWYLTKLWQNIRVQIGHDVKVQHLYLRGYCPSDQPTYRKCRNINFLSIIVFYLARCMMGGNALYVTIGVLQITCYWRSRKYLKHEIFCLFEWMILSCKSVVSNWSSKRPCGCRFSFQA